MPKDVDVRPLPGALFTRVIGRGEPRPTQVERSPSHVGDAGGPPYHVSKGAVRLMTKTEALLHAPDRTRVNSLHPAYIWTPMVAGVSRDFAGWPEAFRQIASDEAKFVTGSEHVIDDGYTAR